MKNCQICGKENGLNAGFCENCGAKFPDQINPVVQNQEQNYSQPYHVQATKSSKKGIFIGAAIAVIIAVMLVGIWLIYPMIDNTTSTRIPVEGGPTVNIESLVNGGGSSFAMSTPLVDHTAVYGFFMNNERIGEISFTNEGEVLYDGEICYKITGSSYYDVTNSYLGSGPDDEDPSSTEVTSRISYEFVNFVIKSNNVLLHAEYDIETPSIQGQSGGESQMVMDFNQITNEIITQTTQNGQTTTSTIQVSDNYWDMTDVTDFLYVGYSDEFTISYDYPDSDYSMDFNIKIEVTSQEDITVSQGQFNDCYVVEVQQDMSYFSITSKVWVTADGICPKMQFGTASSMYTDNSSQSINMVLELEEYYTS